MALALCYLLEEQIYITLLQTLKQCIICNNNVGVAVENVSECKKKLEKRSTMVLSYFVNKNTFSQSYTKKFPPNLNTRNCDVNDRTDQMIS